MNRELLQQALDALLHSDSPSQKRTDAITALKQAHAAAVSADKDARIKVLEDALKSFTKSTYIRHQHPRRFAAAVAALGDKTPNVEVSR